MKIGMTVEEYMQKQKAKAKTTIKFAYLPTYCRDTDRVVWWEYVYKVGVFTNNYKTWFHYEEMSEEDNKVLKNLERL